MGGWCYTFFFFLAITPRPDERVFNTNKTFSGENKERERKRVVYKYIICKRTPRLLEIISTVIKKKKKEKNTKMFLFSPLLHPPMQIANGEKLHARIYNIIKSVCRYVCILLRNFIRTARWFPKRFVSFSTAVPKIFDVADNFRHESHASIVKRVPIFYKIRINFFRKF